MTTLNQGRNEIRLNNSNAKCLLENWVEERAVTDYDPADQSHGAEVFKHGHKGLLTTELNATPEKVSTTKDDYGPKRPLVSGKGARQQLLEQMIHDQVSKEVHDEFSPPPPKPGYLSTAQGDYYKEFTPSKPAPTATHDYKHDQPVTFWTEHRDRITGVTQVKTHDTAFRKNDAFSQPINEYFNDPQPYEDEMVPKM